MKKIGLLLVGIVSIFGVVGNASAASMPNAIDGKITLSEDLQLTETFTVSEGEEITLDLAGHTITGSADIDYYTIENNGNLTIEQLQALMKEIQDSNELSDKEKARLLNHNLRNKLLEEQEKQKTAKAQTQTQVETEALEEETTQEKGVSR